MTVKELIGLLQLQPKDKEVVIWSYRHMRFRSVINIELIEADYDRPADVIELQPF